MALAAARARRQRALELLDQQSSVQQQQQQPSKVADGAREPRRRGSLSVAARFGHRRFSGSVACRQTEPASSSWATKDTDAPASREPVEATARRVSQPAVKLGEAAVVLHEEPPASAVEQQPSAPVAEQQHEERERPEREATNHPDASDDSPAIALESERWASTRLAAAEAEAASRQRQLEQARSETQQLRADREAEPLSLDLEWLDEIAQLDRELVTAKATAAEEYQTRLTQGAKQQSQLLVAEGTLADAASEIVRLREEVRQSQSALEAVNATAANQRARVSTDVSDVEQKNQEIAELRECLSAAQANQSSEQAAGHHRARATIEQLRAAQSREQAAAAQALDELERHKAALIEAEMAAVVAHSDAQKTLDAAVQAERAAGIKLATEREAAARAEMVAVKQALAETQIAHAEDKAHSAATRMELDRIAVVLSHAEARATEAKRASAEVAADSAHAGTGRLRLAAERVKRSEAEAEHLRQELSDAQEAHAQDKAAAKTTRNQLFQHKHALGHAKTQLAEAARKLESERGAHLKEVEGLRMKLSASEQRRRKAEGALAACKKRLASVEAADRRRQQAADAATAEAQAEAAEMHERQAAFSARLDDVIAELEQVEKLCEQDKRDHEEQLALAHEESAEQLRQAKEETQEQVETGVRLQREIRAWDMQSTGLAAQLNALGAENAGLEQELLAATEGREAAVAELETVRLRAGMDVAAMQGMARGMASATTEEAAQQSAAAAAGMRAQAVETARQMSQQRSPHRQAEEPARTPEREQPDPRAAVRWAGIRMQLTRLDGESQGRQKQAQEQEQEPLAALASLLERDASPLDVEQSFAVTPVCEPRTSTPPHKQQQQRNV